MRVRFDDPDAGWIGLSIQGDVDRFEQSFSYAGYDAFQELVLALERLLLPNTTANVTCLLGPGQFDLAFRRAEQLVQFSVVEYPDHRRLDGTGDTVFAQSGSYQQIVVPFWRALRNLESRFGEEELARRWHREFPHAALDRLTMRIRQTRPRSA